MFHSFDSNLTDPADEQNSASADGPRMRGGAADARPAPRVVTTGRKKKAGPNPEHAGDVFDTGERIQLSSCPKEGVRVTRLLDTNEEAPADAAFLDALAFSVVPPDEKSFPWVIEQMQAFMPIETIEYRRGLFGFKFSAQLNEGAAVIAWGGESQRGRVFFSLMGQGCALISDWAGLQSWLEQSRAAIKRADVAYDDFEGKLVSIAWAVEQYQTDGFNAGGRRPRSECYGDWLEGEASTRGRTLGIGSRASGKYTRCYEKGKQLGDAVSPWTRIEVEWRAQDRHIPYDILTRPGQYLAGAYPCMTALGAKQASIKTIAKAAEIAYDRAVANAKLHSGKVVNLMLAVAGGDFSEVVNQLIRPGMPERVAPYSYHVKQEPMKLDRQLRGVAS